MFGRMSAQSFGFLSNARESNVIYSNIDRYIVNGTRITHGASSTNDATSTLLRSNVLRSSILTVTSEVSIESFMFVRVPVNSWTTLSNPMSLTLAPATGSAGTINAGTGSLIFSSVLTKNYPTTSRYSGADVNNATARTQYDFNYLYRTSPVLLTSGTYSIVYNSAGGNVDMAELYTTNVSVDNTRPIRPDALDSLNATKYPVMQILTGFP